MGANEHLHGVYGTAYYVAPEVLAGDYDEKCDIWSVGILLYALLHGSPPFTGRTDQEIMESVKRGEFSIEGPIWDEVTLEAKDLILKMLTIDPT